MDAKTESMAPIQRARNALRRLAAARLDPTPDNYRRAYLEVGGDAGGATASAPAVQAAQALRVVENVAARLLEHAPATTSAAAAAALAQALAQARWDEVERRLDAAGGAGAGALAALIERIARGIEQGGKDWTAARKKDCLRRVLAGSRSDTRRLLQRLTQLVSAWEGSAEAPPAEGPDEAGGPAPQPAAPSPSNSGADVSTVLAAASPEAVPASTHWVDSLTRLATSVTAALPARDAESARLADALAAATRRLGEPGAGPDQVAAIDALCQQADTVLQHRQRLFDQLGALCAELAASLSELSENDSWARGQCDAMRLLFEQGLSARGLRSVSELLAQTRTHQAALRLERDRARLALKAMVASMLAGLGELGVQTGRFESRAARYADVIEQADTLESLSGVVRELVDESRSVHAAVAQTRERLQAEHDRATELAQAVDHLESELRRLSDEVSTDQLTQVANRRGLLQAFEIEALRVGAGGSLAIGLLDIDNFKRLNDELGHQAGDQALKALAASIDQALRPADQVARYGGEEFVVLLPQTSAQAGQAILTRLQRALTGGLFMHESQPVLVTFSAGVTDYRAGEPLEDAVARADRAMYEAKRTGKNRTCIA